MLLLGTDGKDIMQEWIGIVTNEIITIWLALVLMATWLTILTAVFVWHIRKPNASNESF